MMKYAILFTALVLFLMSCEDEETIVSYDFSVLGIEKITIDNAVINLDDYGFPDTSDESIIMVGFSNEASKRSYDLILCNPMPAEEAIHVESKFDDVNIEVEKNEASEYYDIIVSRNGYQEKLIYRIAFMAFAQD